MKALLSFMLLSSISMAQISSHSFVYQGQQRNYIVFLPSAYGVHKPVVINLHGATMTGQDEMIYTGMNSIADTAGFLAVYLVAITGMWNSGVSDDPSHPAPNVDDVGFISALIDTLYADYNIDRERVYVCGLSNGGFMSHKLAGELSSRIAAVASVAGVLTNSTASTSHPAHALPILYIHGTADPVVPFNGNSYWFSAEQTVQHWLSRDTCAMQADTVNLPDVVPGDGCTVQKISYTNCSGNVEVIFYKVVNGGHSWPGATQDGTWFGNLNMDINAGVEIWNFAKRFILTPVTEIAADPATRVFPCEYSLAQNYPNPFNPSTTIRYGLPQRSHVTLTVFNTLGQQVAELVNREMEPGYHEVKFDASGLASGMYFYRLQAGTYVQTRKLLLLK